MATMTKPKCDNVCADPVSPGVLDIVALWTRMQMGLPSAGALWADAMGNLIEQDGAHVMQWLISDHNITRLSDERYEGDGFWHGRWDCEILDNCYCVYDRAGLDPLDWRITHITPTDDGDVVHFESIDGDTHTHEEQA